MRHPIWGYLVAAMIVSWTSSSGVNSEVREKGRLPPTLRRSTTCSYAWEGQTPAIKSTRNLAHTRSTSFRRETVWRIVKKHCVAAGIPPDRLGARGIGVHSLRKTALNNAIQNGAQLHEARELAGHCDIRTTELYFVHKDEDAERAARRIAIR